MSLNDGQDLYKVVGEDLFLETWAEAIRDGLIGEMIAPVLLSAIRMKLSENPWALNPILGEAIDVRRIRYHDLCEIWYSICEEDRTVSLEEVVPCDE